MDGDERRFTALLLTVAIVLALTGLLTWGVLHKIGKQILKPGLQSVEEPASQKAN